MLVGEAVVIDEELMFPPVKDEIDATPLLAEVACWAANLGLLSVNDAAERADAVSDTLSYPFPIEAGIATGQNAN